MSLSDPSIPIRRFTVPKSLFGTALLAAGLYGCLVCGDRWRGGYAPDDLPLPECLGASVVIAAIGFFLIQRGWLRIAAAQRRRPSVRLIVGSFFLFAIAAGFALMFIRAADSGVPFLTSDSHHAWRRYYETPPHAESAGADVERVEPELQYHDTELIGGTGGRYFRTLHDGPITRLHITFGSWNNEQVLRSIEAVDHSGYGYSRSYGSRDRGQELAAEDGYVFGGLVVSADTNAVAVRVIFIRDRDGKLDPRDTYQSDWIGVPTGDETVQLCGRGEEIVGFCGHKGLNLDAIGLVYRDVGTQK